MWPGGHDGGTAAEPSTPASAAREDKHSCPVFERSWISDRRGPNGGINFGALNSPVPRDRVAAGPDHLV